MIVIVYFTALEAAKQIYDKLGNISSCPSKRRVSLFPGKPMYRLCVLGVLLAETIAMCLPAFKYCKGLSNIC